MPVTLECLFFTDSSVVCCVARRNLALVRCPQSPQIILYGPLCSVCFIAALLSSLAGGPSDPWAWLHLSIAPGTLLPPHHLCASWSCSLATETLVFLLHMKEACISLLAISQKHPLQEMSILGNRTLPKSLASAMATEHSLRRHERPHMLRSGLHKAQAQTHLCPGCQNWGERRLPELVPVDILTDMIPFEYETKEKQRQKLWGQKRKRKMKGQEILLKIKAWS